jgi:hypothetical protein
MSKATIKMCLSTTGFGARGGFNIHPPRHSRITSKDTKSLEEIPASLNPNAPYFFTQKQPVEHRPNRRPAFDYDLRNLFSDEETQSTPLGRFNNRSSLQSRTQPPSFAQQLPILKNENSQNALSPSQFPTFQPLTSSGLNSPSALSAPLPLTSPSTTYQTISPSFSNAQPNSAPYTNAFGTPLQGQTSYQMLSPFSDLDFLDTLPMGNDAASGEVGGMNDFNMDMGMGWDGSLPGLGGGEEGGVDLFDGFFFGGNMGMG